MAVLPVDYQDAGTPTGALTELPASTTRGLNAITGQINTNSTDIAAAAKTSFTAAADSEVALFSGTDGKSLKRGTGSGLAKLTAGVLSTASAGSDYVAPAGALGTPSSGTLTNCTGLPVAGITASTATALGVGSINLGHASDTTLTRVSAGVMAVEGSTVLTAAALTTALADAPIFIVYAAGWAARPNTNRRCFFLGGATATNAPNDAQLRASDVWIPAS